MISVEFRDWINEKVLQYLPSQRQRVGDKIICRCPLCGDSKKNSLKKRGYYYLKTASYYCFNCGESLSGMKLLERLSGENYSSLRDEYFKMTFDGKHFKAACCIDSEKKSKIGNIMNLKNVLKNEWKKPLSDNAKNYLKGRMVLDAPFLKEELYSYFSKNGDEYILIPWKINGIDCYYQINDFEKHSKTGMKYIFPKNKDKLIYGLDNIDINFPYILCFEGVYDSLFVKNACAIGGKNLTKTQYELIRKRYPNHRICLALDNDEPGLKSVAKTLKKGSSDDFSYFKWFSEDTKQKDINDYVLFKNNPNIFKCEKYVESCIVDPLIMKMWLSKRGLK